MAYRWFAIGLGCGLQAVYRRCCGLKMVYITSRGLHVIYRTGRGLQMVRMKKCGLQVVHMTGRGLQIDHMTESDLQMVYKPRGGLQVVLERDVAYRWLTDQDMAYSRFGGKNVVSKLSIGQDVVCRSSVGQDVFCRLSIGQDVVYMWLMWQDEAYKWLIDQVVYRWFPDQMDRWIMGKNMALRLYSFHAPPHYDGHLPLSVGLYPSLPSFCISRHPAPPQVPSSSTELFSFLPTVYLTASSTTFSSNNPCQPPPPPIPLILLRLFLHCFLLCPSWIAFLSLFNEPYILPSCEHVKVYWWWCFSPLVRIFEKFWPFIPRLRFVFCCWFFFFFFKVEISPFYARISPQWRSEVGRPWPRVPWQVAFEAVSG